MIYRILVLFTILNFIVKSDGLRKKRSDAGVRNKLLENPDLFQGDIVLPKGYEKSIRSLALLGSRVTWPGGIVPYEIAPGYTIAQIGIIEGAMRKLESSVAINNVQCIRFRPKIVSDEYYIIIYNGQGCSSYVGRNTGLVLNRTVTLQSSGCLYDGTIMHEFLHALGFFHEQSRADRDNYITVNYGNIQTGMAYNFDKYDLNTTTLLNTPYDYSSVMHYGAYAFSANGSPTIVSRQPGVVFGQRNNLSQYDILGVQRLYNCSSTGVTLPPITTTTTPNLYAVNTTYSSSININRPQYSRPNSQNLSYYYEMISIVVPVTGYYSFRTFSSFDTYGYLYINNFNSSSPTTNMIAEDDDSAGLSQFQITSILQSSSVYFLVVTTYSPGVLGNYTLLASGLNNVILGGSLVSTVYSSALTVNSSIMNLPNTNGNYYYETIQVNISVAGLYSFTSNSTMDTIGYLYINSINASDFSSNLLATDDDSGGNRQFRISYTLQSNKSYIVLFSTYIQYATGPFSLVVQGPTSVILRRINLIFPLISNTSSTSIATSTSVITTTSTRTTTSVRTTTSPRTTTSARTTTTTPPDCLIGDPRYACPASIQTIGQAIPVNPTNRSLSGGFVTSNNTFFNLNDRINVSGYLRSVTVQFNSTKLPSSRAQIRIYTIVPILGSYIACSQYSIPSNQISTSLSIQTFTVPNNTMSVSSGTYIAIGLADTSAGISTTIGGQVLRLPGANLTSTVTNRSSLYFILDNSRIGIKLNYTLII